MLRDLPAMPLLNIFTGQTISPDGAAPSLPPCGDFPVVPLTSEPLHV